MSGYLDDLSPAQAEALERLKAELPELLGELEGAAPSLWGVPLPGGRADKPDALDIALLKFLRADDFAYDAARERLRKCLVWRAAAQIDGIAAQDLGLGAAFAGHDDVRGADRDGRPLVISRFGTMDVETVFGDAERFLLWRVQLMERAVAELAFERGAPETLCQVARRARAREALARSRSRALARHDPFSPVHPFPPPPQVHDYADCAVLGQDQRIKDAIKLFSQCMGAHALPPRVREG